VVLRLKLNCKKNERFNWKKVGYDKSV